MSAVEERIPAASRRRSLIPWASRRANVPQTPGAPELPETPPGLRRLVGRWVPYALSSPALLVLAVIIGFPLVFSLVISFQHFGVYQFVTGGPVLWAGFANYQQLFTGQLVPVLVRTLLFTVTTVGLTIIIGMALALLMRRAHTWARIVLSVALVVVWAVPQVTATQIFIWIFDSEFGLANWLLTALHLGNFTNHDWWANPVSQLGIAAAIVVWGAVPFVAITLFAGLLQIPEDLYEAARVDGAGFVSQLRTITVPLLAPILLLLSVLSVIWDFTVFNQIYVLEQAGGISTETTTFGVWGYVTAFAGQNYGEGAAITMLTVALLCVVLAAAVRMMVRGARTT